MLFFPLRESKCEKHYDYDEFGMMLLRKAIAVPIVRMVQARGPYFIPATARGALQEVGVSLSGT
ncbi:hypothetical protein HDF16_005833 [Granulicella aggregans]|uniref:Uncharacterized protein n=1 Tax=Granulicella aggregans TaxID=474949 RepID=A0A7W8E6W8_9BACT|nr:hypothetical protein [Granulicella aggregans]MBB5061097.1 hypothetical protein [Granulicella aggregans]